MSNLIEKAIFASVGIAYLTKERIQEVGKKLAEDAHVAESDGKRFIDELQKRAEETRNATAEFVNKQVSVTLKRLDIPSREEVNALKERIAKLERDAEEKS